MANEENEEGYEQSGDEQSDSENQEGNESESESESESEPEAEAEQGSADEERLAFSGGERSRVTRSGGAPASDTGTAFMKRAEPGLGAKLILDTLLDGKTPPFMERFVTIQLAHGDHTGTIEVSPDYVSIGTDADFIRMPMLPRWAQKYADERGCLLPTKHLVDLIYKQAPIKLHPEGLSKNAGPQGPLYREHDRKINDLFKSQSAGALGSLVAGHKKDVVVSKRLYAGTKYRGKLAFYGLFRANGSSIQPFDVDAHDDIYVDYSHGIRLISSQMRVDGVRKSTADVLADPELAPLLTGNEGVIPTPRYPAP